MTLEPKYHLAIEQAADRAAACRCIGDEVGESYWTERAQRLSDAREAAHCATFDVLKGSPDHSAGFYEKPVHA